MQNMFIGKGNLGDSPELKRVNGRNGEFVVASMRVMFARWGQNEQGDLEQVGGFWREVEIYGEKAEACAKHLKKGARVLVLGEERDFMANDKDSGEQVQVIKIVADDVALQLSRIESITFQQARAREEAPA
ncbi:MAG: single-stranded DNA-binding protein [Hydrogenophaga sp.]|jgi:single-strand DNA-binding protein|uniref:single-stranded DNA-binding protein n=1 Tax=Hydrogenophaga sp. TaxID=1904254 RepID=UPI0025C1F501|nr:single-stranded DNA-binding protein [Hydrogenophaga sp.]MBU4281584.1 single-stranded DNA-binding protein [Gammaproteobacteria bacterium]MCG2658204.1 single-stranded DNA-binding protein [Hydrogenophaga sp.]MDO9483434.1 single-stranded DNA-binding protein [Hydrogenophaga sp.]MDP3804984.1 single-stranded DNA-binding protein [Hydrogenophaga sp.]MDP3924795.1 single-stranded DNA-binding protein [Hydrogenophaga sp.]